MERKQYTLTQQQIEKIKLAGWQMPSDNEIKAIAHKKRRPWGLVKRDLALEGLKYDLEYLLGIWQGRVDKARGFDYSKERKSSSYNLGYHRGYCNYESDRRGWDQKIRDEFDQKYLLE